MQEEEMIIIMMITKNEENKKGKKFPSLSSPLSFIVPGTCTSDASKVISFFFHHSPLSFIVPGFLKGY
jgi:hypothetical protein